VELSLTEANWCANCFQGTAHLLMKTLALLISGLAELCPPLILGTVTGDLRDTQLLLKPVQITNSFGIGI